MVSIIQNFTIDAPISPLRASTVENPPMPSKYLHTLFSIICSFSMLLFVVVTTALPNRSAGIAISFQIALPTSTLSALFFI